MMPTTSPLRILWETVSLALLALVLYQRISGFIPPVTPALRQTIQCTLNLGNAARHATATGGEPRVPFCLETSVGVRVLGVPAMHTPSLSIGYGQHGLHGYSRPAW